MKLSKKKIKIMEMLCCTLLCFWSGSVSAQENKYTIEIIQTDTESKKPVEGIKFSLYQVAVESETDITGYEFTDTFRNSGVDLAEIRMDENFVKCIEELDSYIENNRISGIQSGLTDYEGNIRFSNLSRGLFFVKQTNSEEDFKGLGYTFTTDSYMIGIPGIDEDGRELSVVKCYPKGNIQYPSEGQTELTVYKIWKDNNDKAGKRPDEIKVGLYCNGIKKEEVFLSAENNWMHHWENLEKEDKWSVQELQIPSGYTSEILYEDRVYRIINTWEPPDGTQPKTGDDSNILSWIITISSSFMACMFLVRHKRKNK